MKNIVAFDSNRIDSRYNVGYIKEVAGSFKVYIEATNAQTCEEIKVDRLFRTKKEAKEAFEYADRCFRNRNCGSYLRIG